MNNLYLTPFLVIWLCIPAIVLFPAFTAKFKLFVFEVSAAYLLFLTPYVTMSTPIPPAMANFLLLIPRYSPSFSWTLLGYWTYIQHNSFHMPVLWSPDTTPFCSSSYLYTLSFFYPLLIGLQCLPFSSAFPLITPASSSTSVVSEMCEFTIATL